MTNVVFAIEKITNIGSFFSIKHGLILLQRFFFMNIWVLQVSLSLPNLGDLADYLVKLHFAQKLNEDDLLMAEPDVEVEVDKEYTAPH